MAPQFPKFGEWAEAECPTQHSSSRNDTVHVIRAFGKTSANHHHHHHHHHHPHQQHAAKGSYSPDFQEARAQRNQRWQQTAHLNNLLKDHLGHLESDDDPGRGKQQQLDSPSSHHGGRGRRTAESLRDVADSDVSSVSFQDSSVISDLPSVRSDVHHLSLRRTATEGLPGAALPSSKVKLRRTRTGLGPPREARRDIMSEDGDVEGTRARKKETGNNKKKKKKKKKKKVPGDGPPLSTPGEDGELEAQPPEIKGKNGRVAEVVKKGKKKIKKKGGTILEGAVEEESLLGTGEAAGEGTAKKKKKKPKAKMAKQVDRAEEDGADPGENQEKEEASDGRPGLSFHPNGSAHMEESEFLVSENTIREDLEGPENVAREEDGSQRNAIGEGLWRVEGDLQEQMDNLHPGHRGMKKMEGLGGNVEEEDSPAMTRDVSLADSRLSEGTFDAFPVGRSSTNSSSTSSSSIQVKREELEELINPMEAKVMSSRKGEGESSDASPAVTVTAHTPHSSAAAASAAAATTTAAVGTAEGEAAAPRAAASTNRDASVIPTRAASVAAACNSADGDVDDGADPVDGDDADDANNAVDAADAAAVASPAHLPEVVEASKSSLLPPPDAAAAIPVPADLFPPLLLPPQRRLTAPSSTPASSAHPQDAGKWAAASSGGPSTGSERQGRPLHQRHTSFTLVNVPKFSGWVAHEDPIGLPSATTSQRNLIRQALSKLIKRDLQAEEQAEVKGRYSPEFERVRSHRHRRQSSQPDAPKLDSLLSRCDRSEPERPGSSGGLRGKGDPVDALIQVSSFMREDAGCDTQAALGAEGGSSVKGCGVKGQWTVDSGDPFRPPSPSDPVSPASLQEDVRRERAVAFDAASELGISQRQARKREEERSGNQVAVGLERRIGTGSREHGGRLRPTQSLNGNGDGSASKTVGDASACQRRLRKGMSSSYKEPKAREGLVEGSRTYPAKKSTTLGRRSSLDSASRLREGPLDGTVSKKGRAKGLGDQQRKKKKKKPLSPCDEHDAGDGEGIQPQLRARSISRRSKTKEAVSAAPDTAADTEGASDSTAEADCSTSPADDPSVYSAAVPDAAAAASAVPAAAVPAAAAASAGDSHAAATAAFDSKPTTHSPSEAYESRGLLRPPSFVSPSTVPALSIFLPSTVTSPASSSATSPSPPSAPMNYPGTLPSLMSMSTPYLEIQEHCMCSPTQWLSFNPQSSSGRRMRLFGSFAAKESSSSSHTPDVREPTGRGLRSGSMRYFLPRWQDSGMHTSRSNPCPSTNHPPSSSGRLPSPRSKGAGGLRPTNMTDLDGGPGEALQKHSTIRGKLIGFFSRTKSMMELGTVKANASCDEAKPGPQSKRVV